MRWDTYLPITAFTDDWNRLCLSLSRERCGLTQQEVAALGGGTGSQLSSIERGVVRSKPDTVYRYTSALAAFAEENPSLGIEAVSWTRRQAHFRPWLLARMVAQSALPLRHYAVAAGMPLARLKSVINGDGLPEDAEMVRLAAALGVDPLAFVSREKSATRGEAPSNDSKGYHAGYVLRAARERAGMSFAELSKQTSLPIRRLREAEDDEAVDVAILRVYVRVFGAEMVHVRSDADADEEKRIHEANGVAVRQARRAFDLSQELMAMQLGIQQQRLSAIENGAELSNAEYEILKTWDPDVLIALPAEILPQTGVLGPPRLAFSREGPAALAEETASFGDIIQQRRVAVRMTRAELAERSGLTVASIRNIESDRQAPSARYVAQLVKVLGPITIQETTFDAVLAYRDQYAS